MVALPPRLGPSPRAGGIPGFSQYRLHGRFDSLAASIGDPLPDTRDEARQYAPFGDTNGAFYRTTRDDAGKLRFVDPAGNRMFLSGVGVVNYRGHYSAALGYAPYYRTVQAKYPTLEDWATNTLRRVGDWGFNFLSSPSENLLRRGFPHASVVNHGMGQNFACYGDEFDILPCDGGPCSGFPNVFHPLWPAYCRFAAQSFCRAEREDPWILGWYTDNELSWWGDKRQFKTPPASGLFDAAAKKAPGHPAREALEAFLAERGFAGAAASAPTAVKREFVRLCARKYFEATTAAIREADPNHLILGCRFAGLPSADPYAEQVAALASLQRHPEASRAADVPQPREVEPPRGEDFARAMAAPHAEGTAQISHAEFAENAESVPSHTEGAAHLSHAEGAESAEYLSHAEGAEGAAHLSHAEGAESAETVPISASPGRCASVLKRQADSLVVAGKGVFSAMLREYSRGGVWWTAAGECSEGEREAPHSRVFTFRGAAASGPFEVAMRFYEPAGRDFFVAELLSVRNAGDRPLPFDAVFFRLMPLSHEGAEAARGDDVFEPPKEGQPTPIPPMLWRPWRSGAWILPDGTALGLLSPRQTGVQIRFWRDEALHSDAEMRYSLRALNPGETWTPSARPFVIGGAAPGGEDGWREFCNGIKQIESTTK